MNPIAGMGGRVGLKGTDNVVRKAVKLGAEQVSPKRAIDFLHTLKDLKVERKIVFVTCPRPMGECEVESAGFPMKVLPMQLSTDTTSKDTKKAVKLMVDSKVDLLVFVGGDGTARDIVDSMLGKKTVPVLGVPSGVKLYSSVFAFSPSDAAEVVSEFIQGKAELMDFEILDADEKAIRRGQFSLKLYGILRGPFVPMRTQSIKQISVETVSEHDNQLAIARFVVEEMDPRGTYILAPGTTVKSVADMLKVDKTLLGVDLYHGGKVVNDVNEKTILSRIADWSLAWIVVSPIGRQGILFGRGNQQISPEIIERIGKERIIVVATKNKIKGIGPVFRVDTGSLEVNKLLRGYIRVVIDYREWRMVQIR